VFVSGCAASMHDGLPVYRAPLDAPPSDRTMPAGCRMVATTPPVSMTEQEIDGQKNPYRAWYRVVFERYAGTPAALKTLPPAATPKS
jgi:hypothetical protein